jgi:hypothetical protein
MDEHKQIGYVVGGGLKDNLVARITAPPLEVHEGSFVVIQDDIWQFYGLVTDIELGATDPRFADEKRGSACRITWRVFCMGRPFIRISRCCPL